ncbi:MAG: hypothetical protein EZS28_027047 [Streblomastix strix]|uniref:Uncharacterized protein n=1 Tax=Streblomastix strix TaxID=222440 RepID=A0A5J4V3C8_9EUKA|nr:MAG: hypothetical protein EZS28_027047 [Streblomastix strix]
MGFFSGIANFGSKILGGVKKAAQWVAPALHKVLSTISGPVSMILPAIGGALGAGANLAGAVDRLQIRTVRQLITNDIAYYIQYQKRVNSSGGMMSNEDAESGTVWMYDAEWYNSGDIVPDQVTPASDATPLSDGTATAGISTEYSRGDHVHPLNVTTTIPISYSASGSVGTTNYYARNDHSHPHNITTSISQQDSASGSVGTTNYYARNDHSHPINVETNASNIPVVNGVGANGTSAFYARQDHVHPQQLTYDGNVTATKFIKTGGLTTEVLCANGDTKAISDIVSNYVDLTTIQTISGVKTFDSLKKTNGTNQQILLADGTNKSITDFNTSVIPRAFQIDFVDGIYWILSGILEFKTDIIEDLKPHNLVHSAVQNQFINNGGVINGITQINPNTANYSQGLRISRSVAGCVLTIGLSSESGASNRGLRISADGNTLSFNGSVIAGTGASNGAANGSVNYSAGNPILWGVNSVDTECGFYSDDEKVYWRAKPITVGPIPP